MTHIAVIIVTWNASRLIEGVLRALDRQTLKPDRVLVIDNGSEDTEATARQIAAFPAVEWHPLPNNRGFAAANNYGIERCQEMELIALLNPDAYPQPDWLAQLAQAASAMPQSASFASRLLNHGDPRILDGAGDCLYIHGKPKRRGHGALAEGAFMETEFVFCPSAAAALYRRQALIEVGGFDEDYFCYLEDVDLGFRLRLCGYESTYVPRAVVYHVGSATTGGQHSSFSVYHGHRNLVWTFVKNMPGVLFWLMLPFHVLLNIVTVPYFVLRGQGGVAMRAKIDAIKGLPRVWRNRQEIQAKRVASIWSIWRALDKNMIS
jgi:GT2 family glycosyltransferase